MLRGRTRMGGEPLCGGLAPEAFDALVGDLEAELRVHRILLRDPAGPFVRPVVPRIVVGGRRAAIRAGVRSGVRATPNADRWDGTRAPFWG